MAGQTRVDTHAQKKDATHKKKSDTPAQNTTHCLGSFRLSVGPMLSRDNQFVPTNNRLLAFAVSHFLLSSLLLVTLISVEERLQVFRFPDTSSGAIQQLPTFPSMEDERSNSDRLAFALILMEDELSVLQLLNVNRLVLT